jgi:hypothetical protein
VSDRRGLDPAAAYQFSSPDAIAADGTNVWVTNADQSVTGFPAS